MCDMHITASAAQRGYGNSGEVHIGQGQLERYGHERPTDTRTRLEEAETAALDRQELTSECGPKHPYGWMHVV